jgi:hypothetical protein
LKAFAKNIERLLCVLNNNYTFFYRYLRLSSLEIARKAAGITWSANLDNGKFGANGGM